MSLAEIFEPAGARVIVEPDKVPDVIGIGLGGGALVRPENSSAARPRTGVILRAGSGCHSVYRPGVRVVFGPYDGTKLAMDGEEALLLDSMAILAHTDGAEDEGDLLGESWKANLQPPPGQFLVQRAAMPTRRGKIIIPDGIQLANRSSEAEIVAYTPASTEQPFVPVGQRVFLAGTTSRRVELGRREDVTLWVTRPPEISGILHERPEGILEQSEDLHLAAIPELAKLEDDTPNFEEGDRRAPR